MTSPIRTWWHNCAYETDPEMQLIDQMEDTVYPISESVRHTRELISSLELCHHKAMRWIENIIAAIGTGDMSKGLGTRPSNNSHPIETVWQDASTVLAAWCAGQPSASISGSVGDVPASELLDLLTERTAIREWQVHRVIEKIRSVLHWPQPLTDRTAQYTWLLIDERAESMSRDHCPDRYCEHEDFWLTTVCTIIHDTIDGEESRLSLGHAIDMLWPCHWNFVGNLRIVLSAIGGYCHTNQPFTACSRNVSLMPHTDELISIVSMLDCFSGNIAPPDPEQRILKQLGKPNNEKQWLAASLAKTIRLQLHVPDALRKISDLSVPKWIDSRTDFDAGISA